MSAVATGAVAADSSTADIVGGAAIEIVSNLDWIDLVADWFSNGSL
ncbi:MULTISPECIES: hypothetical protein [Burkholderia]|uniref:Uncharacterized protein n=2 Tax=Burkholderia TaxID=32008 RepID=A0AA88Z6I7_BURCE|nr:MULTISPECIES: hypothetical protein [Burkholderia]KGB99540.1 hypothetical protein DM43_3521 [Burkholderia cepacia]